MAIVSELPKGAEVFDLEAARVARAEARALEGKGNPYIKISAGFIEVQPEVALEAAFLFGEEKLKEGLALLLVDPADIDPLLGAGLSANDLNEIVRFIAGKDLGESKA